MYITKEQLQFLVKSLEESGQDKMNIYVWLSNYTEDVDGIDFDILRANGTINTVLSLEVEN